MDELGYKCREIRVVTLICILQVAHCWVLHLFSRFSTLVKVNKSYCWKCFLIKGDFSNSYFISKKGTSTFEVFPRNHVRFFTKSPWFFLRIQEKCKIWSIWIINIPCMQCALSLLLWIVHPSKTLSAANASLK